MSNNSRTPTLINTILEICILGPNISIVRNFQHNRMSGSVDIAVENSLAEIVSLTYKITTTPFGCVISSRLDLAQWIRLCTGKQMSRVRFPSGTLFFSISKFYVLRIICTGHFWPWAYVFAKYKSDRI